MRWRADRPRPLAAYHNRHELSVLRISEMKDLIRNAHGLRPMWSKIDPRSARASSAADGRRHPYATDRYGGIRPPRYGREKLRDRSPPSLIDTGSAAHVLRGLLRCDRRAMVRGK